MPPLFAFLGVVWVLQGWFAGDCAAASLSFWGTETRQEFRSVSRIAKS